MLGIFSEDFILQIRLFLCFDTGVSQDGMLISIEYRTFASSERQLIRQRVQNVQYFVIDIATKKNASKRRLDEGDCEFSNMEDTVFTHYTNIFQESS